MWRISASESRYSFYQMGWVNPESEGTTEIKFPPWVEFEPTTSWSTVQRVTTELTPLSSANLSILPHIPYSISFINNTNSIRLILPRHQLTTFTVVSDTLWENQFVVTLWENQFVVRSWAWSITGSSQGRTKSLKKTIVTNKIHKNVWSILKNCWTTSQIQFQKRW